MLLNIILSNQVKGKTIKTILLSFMLFFLVGCQTDHKPLFTYNKTNQQLSFQLDSNTQYDLNVRSFKYQQRYSQNVLNAYTLNDEINAISIEHIQLTGNGAWRGQPRSVYENFIKEKLKIKSMQILSRKEINNYEFTTYKIDDKYLLHFIYIWESQRDTFIYDAKGLLYNKLIKKLNPAYEVETYDLSNYSRLFNESLVFYNTIYGYFK